MAAEDQAFLGALAGQCAIAVERARLFERERSTAVALQRSLLPDRLPDAAGVELAARFLPGSPDADVGGDWYDAFTLPDGRLVLVVGDVMGKGVVAAAGMGRLRAALRALALVNPLPEAVLSGLDRVFTATEDPDQIATLVYLLINPAARRAAVGGAGHLPLVLVRPAGEPELVDAGSGSTPLGWPEPRSAAHLELGPGDLLLGVTDGVVERRGYDLDEGLAELVACVRGAHGGLDDLVGAGHRPRCWADTRGPRRRHHARRALRRHQGRAGPRHRRSGNTAEPTCHNTVLHVAAAGRPQPRTPAIGFCAPVA